MEGGVILTNNKIVYNYLLSLRAHGWGRDLPKKIAYIKCLEINLRICLHL